MKENKNSLAKIKPKAISMIKKWRMKQKVSVPSIKQYLVDEFELTKSLEKENKEFYQRIENYKKTEEQYELSLTTLEKYKERIEDRNKEIKDLKEDNSKLKETIKTKDNDINEQKITIREITKENEKIKDNIKKSKEEAIKELKKVLISKINDTKGILSKEKVIQMINKE